MRARKLIIGLGVVLCTASAACGGDDDTGGAATTGGASCAFTDPTCTAVKSDCIALTDNANADKFGLRMAQLKLDKPAGLKNAQGVIDGGIEMNLEQCRLNGTGLFSWLLEFDKAAGTLKTGGGNPQANPSEGYCFIKGDVGTTPIAPITLDAPLEGGKFSVATGVDVTVPIFAVDQPPVLLPLKNARLREGQLSADQGCIGHYNSEGTKPENSCKPDNELFTVDAALDGFIVLQDANDVVVPQLDWSLCYLLTSVGDGGSPQKCPVDGTGKVTAKGDWCSTTDMPADENCADAYALGATFAASAVKITGDCAPAPP